MEPPAGNDNIDSIVLEEEIDPNYVPSESEVIEYAKWLGMDLELDKDLFWIAREGLMAPLPNNWKPCKTKDTEDIYYFNFATGESTWNHPCDGYYKRLYEEEKKKKETMLKVREIILASYWWRNTSFRSTGSVGRTELRCPPSHGSARPRQSTA
jgi:centrosomal protein CEP164